jgi:hypothetical protein
MVGLIIGILALAIIITVILWVQGIDYMQKNYPDYKGDDFLEDDLEDWEVTISDGLDELEKKEDE